MHFKARSSVALADATLQANLRKFQSTGFTALRAKAVAEFGRQLFEALRGEGAAIRDRSLASLDAWLERFEAEAGRRGAPLPLRSARAMHPGSRASGRGSPHPPRAALRRAAGRIRPPPWRAAP